MRTKKAKSISVLILSLVLVLTACGSKPAGSSTENKAEETTEEDSGSQASKTVFGTFESKTLTEKTYLRTYSPRQILPW